MVSAAGPVPVQETKDERILADLTGELFETGGIRVGGVSSENKASVLGVGELFGD